jgi:DNA-directed RNA polymerase subunit M/transcription elongation factor TFIIS
MGHTYTYRCDHCGYEEQFNEGHGFLIHSQPLGEYLNRNVKLFHYKTHKLLLRLAKQYDNLYIQAGFKVYKCPKCKVLYDKIEVKVYNDRQIVHRSEFRCNICRSRLKLTNIHRLKNAICPVCHNKTFKIVHENLQLWD